MEQDILQNFAGNSPIQEIPLWDFNRSKKGGVFTETKKGQQSDGTFSIEIICGRERKSGRVLYARTHS